MQQHFHIALQCITYHWLCICELINWITFKQTFHVLQSEHHGERAKILNHRFFHTGSLTKPNMLYINVYTYHRMIKFCYYLLSMKSWLTSTALGSRVFFREVSQVKKLLKKTAFKKYVPWTFLLWRLLDWLHRISSTQGVLHQVSQFRKRLKKMKRIQSPKLLQLAFLYQMRDLIISGLENLRLSKYEEKRGGRKRRKMW